MAIGNIPGPSQGEICLINVQGVQSTHTHTQTRYLRKHKYTNKNLININIYKKNPHAYSCQETEENTYKEICTYLNGITAH